MTIKWIVVSVVSGIFGGLITYALTRSWKISLISAVTVLVIVVLNDPKRRFMKAFYVVLFPLLSNMYFETTASTESFDFFLVLKKIGTTETIVLGIIAIVCLLLDYLERKGRLKGALFSIKKNSVGDISGDNNQVNQTND